jgi:deoxycytidine triphosphate deaminase
MIINPNTIIEKQAIKGPYRIEPNAFDFTADKILAIDSNMFYYSNNKQNVIHRTRSEIKSVDDNSLLRVYGHSDDKTITPEGKKGWILSRNLSYDVTSNVYVEVPEGMSAFIVGRSTGNRNGIVITSGLYDSGYKGHIGCTLHNHCGDTYLEEGTFIGQIVFMESDTAKLYAGGYNNAEGEHWTDAVANQTPVATPEPTPVVEVPVEPVGSEAPVVTPEPTPVVEEVVVAPEVVTPVEPVATPAPVVSAAIPQDFRNVKPRRPK